MKAIVAFVLLVSAGLLLVITIGGWSRLEGASVAIMTLLWAILYVVFAVLVSRWNRGVLPVAATLAIILTIFAAVSAPGWFARSKPGLSPGFERANQPGAETAAKMARMIASAEATGRMPRFQRATRRAKST